MARSLKAAAAAAQAAKDRQFRAFQEKLGLSSDNVITIESDSRK
jgi:hypothetical protein